MMLGGAKVTGSFFPAIVEGVSEQLKAVKSNKQKQQARPQVLAELVERKPKRVAEVA